MKTYTEADVVEALRERIRREPGQSREKVAKSLRVTIQYISLVLLGRKPPGPAIWVPLGFHRLPRTFQRRS